MAAEKVDASPRLRAESRLRLRRNSGRLRALLPAFLLTLAVGTPQIHGSEEMRLGFDSAEQWGRWRSVEFPDRKPTAYAFDADERQVCARADQSASGMAHRFPGALDQYPVLSWEWRIEGVLEKGDARRKEGDDYAARVYVNFERDEGLSWWERIRAGVLETIYGEDIPGSSLNFIWANRAESGTVLPNQYTDRARMVVLQSGAGDAGRWIREEITIPEWYRRAFGTDPPPVQSIAIMTDADDTGEQAAACYRNLRLRSAPDRSQ